MKKIFLTLITLLSLASAGCNNQNIKVEQSPVQPIPATSARNTETILTEKDFSGVGLSAKNVNQQEDTFKIQINPKPWIA